MSEHTSHFADVLQGLLDDALRSEVIGGVCVADVLDYVDLDVAYSPVITHRVDGDWPRPEQLDLATPVKRDDGRYEIRYQTDAGPTFEILGPETIRIMRARWLLCRDHFARSIEQYSHPQQQWILADFFPGGLWMPKSTPDAEATGVGKGGTA